MSFFQITIANMWEMMTNFIFLLWMSAILFGRIPRRGMKNAVLCVLMGTGMVICVHC